MLHFFFRCLIKCGNLQVFVYICYPWSNNFVASTCTVTNQPVVQENMTMLYSQPIPKQTLLLPKNMIKPKLIFFFILDSLMGSASEDDDDDEPHIRGPSLGLGPLGPNGPDSVGPIGPSDLSVQSISTDSKTTHDDSDQVNK